MIKGLIGSGSVVVSSGNTYVPYVPINPNNPMQGMIRINGSDMQVFDGSNWIVMNISYASVELTGETELLLNWARRKRDDEEKLQEMMDKYPALKKAKDNFDILLNLVKDDYEM